MSTALQRQYSLQHAYAVTADSNNSADRVETVAKATAELMHSILHDGDVIGVDCGRTVAHVAPHLSRLPKCDVIQLTGLAGTLTTTGVHLVRRISAITGGTSWPLYAPLAMADARTAGSLADDPQIQETRAQQSKVSCAIVSIGAWSARRVPGLHVATRRRAAGRGVCAETCALLLDANCNRVHGLGECHMGISDGNLRTIPTVIAVTTGPEKIARLRGPCCAITTPRPRIRQCAVWSRPVFGQWPRWFVAKCHSKPL